MNYQLNDTKMFADISDGLAVIINSETGMYYGMNPFASDIFQNIISGASDEDIVAAAVKIGAPENFEASFDNLVAGLLEKEIIVPAEHKQMQANLNAAFAEECSFEIVWDEFNDAQELLLADPIHEVKEDSGWTPYASSLNPDAEDVERRKAKM